jgi:hypothetical protein
MDIRNIKTNPPEVINGNYLDNMFQLQKELMEGYIKIEGLPNYPININNKKAQSVLKDFSSRVIEEMAEGFESTTMALELLEKVGYNKDILKEDERQMLLNHLQNSNEEQADATAFYLELFIYAGVTPEVIRSTVEELFSKQFQEIDADTPLLDILMYLGETLVLPSEVERPNLNKYCWPLISDDWFDEERRKKVYGYIPAFHNNSVGFHEAIESRMLWEVTYHLNIGRNYLKNKPWKQSGEMTNENLYIIEIILGFIKYLGYLSVMGFTSESLYTLQYKKNQVNRFRQRSNY